MHLRRSRAGYVPAGIAGSEWMGFAFLSAGLSTSLIKADENEMLKVVHMNVTQAAEADQLLEK